MATASGLRIHIVLCVLFWLAISVGARFSKATCLDNHCLQSFGNSSGVSNICFVPDPMPMGGLSATRCSNSKLESLISIHASRVQRGEAPSIAYWNVLHKRVLGGADWSVHEWQAGLDARVIAACLTGQRSDGSSETVCYIATADNDFAVRLRHCNGRAECGAIHPTTASMLLDRCWTHDRMPNLFDQILGQSRMIGITAERRNLHAVPWMSSADADEEVATLRAIPLTAYQLDLTKPQTGILRKAQVLSEREKPRRVRH